MRRIQIDPAHLPPPPASGACMVLPPQASHYARDVLRLGPGSELELFDGRGRILSAKLLAHEGPGLYAQILADAQSARGESPVRLTLLQAIPKGERWDWVLEKATELGVHRVVPLQTARSVVVVEPGKVAAKVERWQRMAAAAASQSERAVTPLVESPRRVREALAERTETAQFVAHTDGARGAPTLSLAYHLASISASGTLGHGQATEEMAIWIGPEGGFTDEEVHLIASRGGVRCHLGPRILRSETAGIAACALVQAILGDCV